jgi:hypothetical protein
MLRLRRGRSAPATFRWRNGRDVPTYLQLCQSVARESGTLAGGTAFTTVQGATGRIAKVASWVDQAWQGIQNERSSWRWMQRDFTAPLVTGTARYSAADLGLDRVARWSVDTSFARAISLYDPSADPGDEGTIGQIGYDAWRDRYVRTTSDPTRPGEWAISPAEELCFGPTPDMPYVVRGSYTATPQALVLDADVPEMPARFHQLIVWDAMRLLAYSDEAPATAQTSLAQYTILHQNLVRDQLPNITIGYGGGEFMASGR